MTATATGFVVRVLAIGLNDSIVRSLDRCMQADGRLALAGAASSLEVGRMLLAAALPHVILVDWSALNGSAGEAARLLGLEGSARSLGCVVNEDSCYREAAMAAGFEFIVPRERLFEWLPALLAAGSRSVEAAP